MSFLQVFVLLVKLSDNVSFLGEFLFFLIFCFTDKLLEFALELFHGFEFSVMVLLDFDELALEKLLLGDFLWLGLMRGWLGVARVYDIVLFAVFLGEGVFDVKTVGGLFFGGSGGMNFFLFGRVDIQLTLSNKVPNSWLNHHWQCY